MKSARPDLVLINPGGRQRMYQSLGQSLAAIENPVWVGLLASFVRKRGYSVVIIDANALELDEERIAEKVEEIDPLLTAVVAYGHNPSASTQVMPAAGRVCSAIKRRRKGRRPVLLIGGHVAALPNRSLEEEDADFTCSGEGPYTMVALIDALRENAEVDAIQVPGLVTRRDPKPAAAPLVLDLDNEMPGDAWDLLPMEAYRAHNWHCFGGIKRQPYAAIYTTLGCPFKCTFCCIQAPFKSGEAVSGLSPTSNSYRYYSVDHVVAQIDTLVQKYGVTNLKFADEMFVLNRKFVEGICDRLIERNYGLNIWAYARIDSTRDERLLAKLRQAGFTWLAFGIEAGAADVRVSINKAIDQDLIYKTIERVKAVGIYICGNFIFGLPHDDYDSMERTLAMALELQSEYTNFYSTMAYPGSSLYREALEAGWRLPATWGGYSQFATDTLPLPTRALSGGEVLGFRDAAFQRYYSDPTYLAMMKQRFGQEAIDEIRLMTSHSIERQHAVVPGNHASQDQGA